MPHTKEAVSSIEGVLALLPENDNPFLALQEGLRREFFVHHETGMNAGVYTMCALSACALAGSIICLVARIRRNDRWLYRKVSAPSGASLIYPNAILNWLIYNILYTVLLFPFVFFACMRVATVDYLSGVPLWLTLTFLPLYLGLWHTAWSTSISAATINSKTLVPPIILNVFFILVPVAAIVASVATSALCTAQWQTGLGAYRELDRALHEKGAGFLGVGNASTVIAAIPESDRLVATMADSFWRFSNPSQVCATFAILLGLVMTTAGSIQCTHLIHEIRRLSAIIRTRQQSASLVSEETRHAGMHAEEKPEEKLAGVVATLKTVVLTTVLLTVAALAYQAMCWVGKFRQSKSDLYRISGGYQSKLYIYLFFYSWLDAIIVYQLLVGTFSATTRPRTSTPSVNFSGDTKTSTPAAAMKRVSRVPVPLDGKAELDHPSSFPPDLKRADGTFARPESFASGISLGFTPLNSEPSPVAFFGPSSAYEGLAPANSPPPASPSSPYRALPALPSSPAPSYSNDFAPGSSYASYSRSQSPRSPR